MRKFAKKTGPQAIGKFVAKSTKAALIKRGFAQADILSKWKNIVGPTLANVSSPERLNYGRSKNHEATLKVRVSPGFAPEFQQFEPLIIERINSFFGYRAVARLQLIQAPVKTAENSRKPLNLPLSSEQEAWLKETLNDVTDEELKEKLFALGSKIITRASHSQRLKS
ncbi:DUF721 domain-containing protein [Sneathiella glossodoripedis]|uniref:DUF721 domain-containing protein n=1 Tax=Sneathiella glossodoripedis TaxID=418853 RepID=UPI00046F18D9|nr:DciA family protein [Sneathiella glossodoripedis]